MSGTERLIVIDTETCGFGRQAQLVELGAAVVEVRTGMVTDLRSMLIDPGRAIPRDATAIHGITDAMVRGKPDANSVMLKFHKWCLQFGPVPVFAAHNAPFDRDVLKAAFEAAGFEMRQTWPMFCTLKLARRLVKKGDRHNGETMVGHGLESLVKFYGIAHTNLHRAAGDVRATAALLAILMNLPIAKTSTLEDLHSAPYRL